MIKLFYDIYFCFKYGGIVALLSILCLSFGYWWYSEEKSRNRRRRLANKEAYLNQFNVLDLHGHLTTESAIEELQRFIERQYGILPNGQNMVLDIITGWGRHAVREPIIKPAVLEYCTNHNLEFWQPEDNRGKIKIRIYQ